MTKKKGQSMEQITDWLVDNAKRFPSQYGDVTNMEWLEKERARLSAAGIGSEIRRHEKKERMVALFRR